MGTVPTPASPARRVSQSATVLLYDVRQYRLLARRAVTALVTLEHRGHLVAHTLHRPLTASDHAEGADHGESADSQGDVGAHTPVLRSSEKHHVSPFFVVFLFFHAFYFLFAPLTKVRTCYKIYIRKDLRRYLCLKNRKINLLI